MDSIFKVLISFGILCGAYYPVLHVDLKKLKAQKTINHMDSKLKSFDKKMDKCDRQASLFGTEWVENLSRAWFICGFFAVISYFAH
jgi:hypothetical protein